MHGTEAKSGPDAVLDSQPLGIAGRVTMGTLIISVVSVLDISWERSLTFVCDESSPIYAETDAEGRRRTDHCGLGKRVGCKPSRVRIPHPPLR